jgi:hypothetical protein
MKYFLVVVLLVVGAIDVKAKSVEEHILVSYSLVVDKLKARGFGGPLAEEVGRYALIRQLIEDGANREHSLSIVGMSLGGVNERVMCELGLTAGDSNPDGFTLKKVTSGEGQTFYSIHGPRADVCSVVAITLLWDRYVNEVFPDAFRAGEREAWNESKAISNKLCVNKATDTEIRRYYGELASPRRRAIEKANRMYSPTAAGAITKIVNDMKEIFDFARF